MARRAGVSGEGLGGSGGGEESSGGGAGRRRQQEEPESVEVGTFSILLYLLNNIMYVSPTYHNY